MKTTLYFTKHFTKGNLKGITINETLSFVTVESAAGWIKAIKAKCAAGKLPYQIIDHSFQNYFRN